MHSLKAVSAQFTSEQILPLQSRWHTARDYSTFWGWLGLTDLCIFRIFPYFVRIYSLNTEVQIYQIVYAFGVLQNTLLIINISVSSGLFSRHRGWYSITPARFYRHPPYAYMYMQHTLSNVDLYTALQRQYLLTCKVSRYCRLPLHGSILTFSTEWLIVRQAGGYWDEQPAAGPT